MKNNEKTMKNHEKTIKNKGKTIWDHIFDLDPIIEVNAMDARRRQCH